MRVLIVDETDDFNSHEQPNIGIAESPLHPTMIVVVFGRAPVMSNAGGASCIQHHRMHPLTAEAVMSWLSNGNMMPGLEVLQAPLQSSLMQQLSNVSLE